MQGIDEIVPVDVYIPGCPPVPEAVLDAVIKLQKQIEADTRLSYETTSPANQAKDTRSGCDGGWPRSSACRLVRFLDEKQEIDGPVARAFKERFPKTSSECANSVATCRSRVKRENIKKVLSTLKNDPAFDFKMLLDVTAADYLSERKDRYEVVYHLLSLSNKHRVRIKAPVPAEDPTIDSAVDVWRGADWSEREAFDMFGIQFKGHPDLRRILTHSQFEGFPLAKGLPAGSTHHVHGDDRPSGCRARQEVCGVHGPGASADP